MYKTRIARWGNSFAARIPEQILKETGIRDGDPVEISQVSGSIIIRKKESKPKSLKAAGILSEYANPELREKEKDAYRRSVVRRYDKSH